MLSIVFFPFKSFSISYVNTHLRRDIEKSTQWLVYTAKAQISKSDPSYGAMWVAKYSMFFMRTTKTEQTEWMNRSESLLGASIIL